MRPGDDVRPWSITAVMAAQTGEAALVPPNTVHGGECPP